MSENVRGAQAIGIANIAMDGTVLDTWYPEPQIFNPQQWAERYPLAVGTTRLGANELTPRMLQLVKLDQDRLVEQVAVRTIIPDLAQPPVDAHDVYLRLHLLSHRLVRPHEMHMQNALELLSNVVWTNKGPCLPENFEWVRGALRSRGLIHVYCVDRLPRMVDYVVPPGVRISEAKRVRLGAYLAPGTSVLREGFVSFNSGTIGAAKIEGRLSSGVVIGEGSEIGLSSTIMSPRDEKRRRLQLTIGKNCHFGVSSGIIGVSLGDNCEIGNNIVLDSDTPIWFADAKEYRTVNSIEGQSNWSIKRETGYHEPVARQKP
ncbi:putative succinyltransferase [Corynebacterium suranareeae]|uniref:Putative succinyltransferase n=1 Tax=Corynebacterium suranareeae TaxID=2506452 RepID=A0A160PNQ4_9CORY|nr:DapH/DapD/GlmU-related protein [Corynebacterium suranareeae]BAU95489.1 putative succinyltransferase [Corynebacterium suranareeae]